MSDNATFERFMEMVSIGSNPGDCWVWTGNRPSGLYGHFSVNLKSVKAHRWMYEHINGPIPEGLVVRHKCDNPPCVKPSHLQVGTVADNVRDKFERGRGADRRGEKHPLAKLCAADVLEIRRLADLGHTHHSLSLKFNVRRGQIGKIVQRLNWRHI